MDTSKKSDGAVLSDSSTEVSLLSTRVDNLTQCRILPPLWLFSQLLLILFIQGRRLCVYLVDLTLLVRSQSDSSTFIGIVLFGWWGSRLVSLDVLQQATLWLATFCWEAPSPISGYIIALSGEQTFEASTNVHSGGVLCSVRGYIYETFTCRMSFWLGVLFRVFSQIFKMQFL